MWAGAVATKGAAKDGFEKWLKSAQLVQNGLNPTRWECCVRGGGSSLDFRFRFVLVSRSGFS